MVLFARSDNLAVAISAEAHGGCGQVHTRPVEHGKPAKVWALTCPPCEDHLRHDPLWASTLSKIPETHDEAANREELEKSQARQQQDIMVQALATLAGNVNRDSAPQAPCPNGHPNAATARFCTQCGSPVARPEAVTCPDGHESPAGARFCVGCGQRLGVLEAAPRVPEAAAEAALAAQLPEPATAPPEALPAPPVPVAPQAPPKRAALPSNTKMRGMKRDDILALAEAAGVDTGGTREQVLNRLIACNNAG